MEVVGWFVLFFIVPAPKALTKGGSSLVRVAPPPSLTSLASKKRVFGVDRAIDIPGDVFPSEIALAELERGMEDCEHLWTESCFEGAQLHYRKWKPAENSKPKGVVIWLHGIAAHSGRSLVMEEDNNRKLGMALQREAWLKAGYALYALDMYGHGYSEGLRWFVPKFEVNRDDLIAFAKLVAADQHEENLPMFLTAESYGACLALHVAKYFQEHPTDAPKGFDSVILHAPAIIPPDLPPKPVVSLLTAMSRSYPTWIPFFMPNPISTTRIWRDKKVYKIFDSKERRDMLIEGGGKPFRLATAVSMLISMEQVREEIIPGFSVPFCVIHGEKDVAVPVSGTELLLEKATTPKENRAVKRHPEAYHDLMADPSAEETMQFMLDFANERVASKK